MDTSIEVCSDFERLVQNILDGGMIIAGAGSGKTEACLEALRRDASLILSCAAERSATGYGPRLSGTRTTWSSQGESSVHITRTIRTAGAVLWLGSSS